MIQKEIVSTFGHFTPFKCVYELSEYMAFTQRKFLCLKTLSFYTKHKSLSTAHSECLCQCLTSYFVSLRSELWHIPLPNYL